MRALIRKLVCNVIAFLCVVPIMGTASGAAPSSAERVLGIYVDALKAADPAKLRTITSSTFDSRAAQKTTSYPILVSLGPVISVAARQTTVFAGSPVFAGEVQHQNGTSNWQFRLSVDGQLMEAAQLLTVKRYPSDPPKPEIADHDNSFLKNAKDNWANSGSTMTRTEATISDTAGEIFGRFARTESSTTTQDPCRHYPTFCSDQSSSPVDPQVSSDPRLVEFLFATNRVLTISNDVATLAKDTDRQEVLSYGAVAVHVPVKHQQGRLELPSVWKLFGQEFKLALPGDRYFAIRRISLLSVDDFKQLARQQGKKTALIFVHGFNTGFEDAVYRNAQIIWDLQYKGLSVLYSWDSKGSAADYLYDRDSAYLGRSGFIQLLSMLHSDLGIEQVNVIAHSMGNLVVIDALTQSANTTPLPKLNQLIMAAPDVASDMFKLELPKVQPLAVGTTLYASSADQALNLSSSLADFPRAGYVPENGPIILPNLDTIDVSPIGNEFLGLNHNEFASNRSVIDDIKLLIEDGKKSPRLAQIRPMPDPPQKQTYWRYSP